MLIPRNTRRTKYFSRISNTTEKNKKLSLGKVGGGGKGRKKAHAQVFHTKERQVLRLFPAGWVVIIKNCSCAKGAVITDSSVPVA